MTAPKLTEARTWWSNHDALEREIFLAWLEGQVLFWERSGVVRATATARKALILLRAAAAAEPEAKPTFGPVLPTDEADERVVDDLVRRAAERKAEPEAKSPDCEHEGHDGEGPCSAGCGMVFVFCRPCSVAGGADRAIYHGEPACPERAP